MSQAKRSQASSGRFIEQDRDDLTVKPLTRAERAWCEELAALLGRAPRRLALYTIGDAGVSVIDAAAEREWYAKTGKGCEDGAAERYGYELGHIDGRIIIHGVSG